MTLTTGVSIVGWDKGGGSPGEYGVGGVREVTEERGRSGSSKRAGSRREM